MRVAPLTQPHLPNPAAGARLSRHEPQPSRERSARFEPVYIAYRSNRCRGSQKPNAGDIGDLLAIRAVAK